MKPKRILWLLNHTTLQAFEVPTLVNLGFEVFVPKICPGDEGSISATSTYAFDATLTLPDDLLARMNGFDFYAARIWPPDLAAALNERFDAAVVAFYPDLVSAACEAFPGPLFLRAFGREGALTYAAMVALCRRSVFERILRRDRIRLATAYDAIAPNEPEWLRRIAVTLPIGLPDHFYAERDRWTGGRGDLLFVCPRIRTCGYYANFYREFKAAFGDLPHIIAGGQHVPVADDPHVLGFVAEGEYRALLRTCAAMLYTSREPRHMHLHQVEAAIVSLPVVYLSGGLLEAQVGRTPGCCDTMGAARALVERLMGGDAGLASEIAAAQRPLADKFSRAQVEPLWRERFMPLAEAS
jgi:hypothetical protein